MSGNNYTHVCDRLYAVIGVVVVQVIKDTQLLDRENAQSFQSASGCLYILTAAFKIALYFFNSFLMTSLAHSLPSRRYIYFLIYLQANTQKKHVILSSKKPLEINIYAQNAPRRCTQRI